MYNNKHKLSDWEWALLVLLAIALPLSEALKNIASVIFLVVWLGAFHKDSQARWFMGKWDWIFTLFIGSATISTLLAFDFGHNWMMWGDTLLAVSLAWTLAHSSLQDRQIHWLLAAIILSTLVATLVGLWQWQISHEKTFFELNSVGYFNQSAMYLGMVAALTAWSSIILYNKINRYLFAGLCVITVLFSCVMLWGESRGGMLAFFLTLVFLVSFFLYNRRINLKKIGLWNLAIVLIFSIFLAINPHLIEKSIEKSQEPGGVSSGRGIIAEVSLEVFKHYPFFGIGVANHEKVSHETMAHWRGEDEALWQQLYPKNFHPHNLYLGTLAERGLVGVVILIILLIAWLHLVFATGRRQNLTTTQWLVWGFGSSVLLVTLFAGFFNTPLRHENARLAFLGLGLMLSIFYTNQRSK